MLAPGDVLLKPVPPEQQPPTTVSGGRLPTNPTTPRVEAKQPEPRSFLMILLGALGAIHS